MLNSLLGMPASASQHGFQIDQMIEFCHWFMLILFVGWFSFFLYLLWRFRASRNPQASYYGAEGTVFKHLEFTVVLIEAVLLLGFALPLWWQRTAGFPDEKTALQVNLVAQAFSWNYHYPGADGKFGRTSMNLVSSTNPVGIDPTDPAGKDDIMTVGEMGVPVGQPVVLRITSKDVIHNFAVPEFRTAKDAIPGTRIPIWFTVTRPGEYTVICGQLCGKSHAGMKGLVKAMPADEFRAWLGEQKTAGESLYPKAIAQH
ncbi:MAG: cytochrome c oxidase subunit II [Candidatus Methylacidiphilales bacterium]|nr:cytochrome c oxidase subunit II [Candidatus Methylacidiphilales bacterium]